MHILNIFTNLPCYFLYTKKIFAVAVVGLVLPAYAVGASLAEISTAATTAQVTSYPAVKPTPPPVVNATAPVVTVPKPEDTNSTRADTGVLPASNGTTQRDAPATNSTQKTTSEYGQSLNTAATLNSTTQSANAETAQRHGNGSLFHRSAPPVTITVSTSNATTALANQPSPTALPSANQTQPDVDSNTEHLPLTEQNDTGVPQMAPIIF